MLEKVKLGIIDVCVCKNIKGKYRLEIIFLLKIGVNKSRFVRTLTGFGFSIKFLVFGGKMLS